MKRRRPVHAPELQGLDALAQALASLDSPAAVRRFLEDLCTPAELEAMADRWSVVPLLIRQVAYREIHEQTGVSVTTIGRVARSLGMGDGYRTAWQSLQDARPRPEPSRHRR
jgi:TrpR-related protein YerC/YecD